MDIKIRKLNVIESLINLQNEKLICKIESLIQDDFNGKSDLGPYTKEQLQERARISNQDFLEGKVISQEDLEIESEKW